MKRAVLAVFFLVCTLSFIMAICSVNAQTVNPSPSWTYSPITPRVGDNIVFDASDFVERWNTGGISTIVSLDWDFGDGSSASGAAVTHAFTSSGTYLAQVTATDSLGNSATSGYYIDVRAQTPITVYMTFSSAVIYTGQEVTISGNLTYNGKGVPNEWITLSSKTYIEGASWNKIATVKTDESGNYATVWKTSYGYYEVKAAWEGNSSYVQSSVSADLIVKGFGNLITDFASNSTITGLNFNSSTNILSFSAEGPDGTSGYVNITLQKEQGFNPENINVLLDGRKLNYTVDSTNQFWLLHFNYNHSAHSIIVEFNSTGIPEFPSSVALLLVLVALPFTMFAVLKQRRRVPLTCRR